jgi:hypothetical protein
MHRHLTFVAILVVSAGVQALLVELAGGFAKTTGLSGMHWLYSILIAAITMPLGIVMRVIPVWDKPSDFADYYQGFFNDRMVCSAAASAGVAVAVP